MSQWWVDFELKGSELSLCGDTSPPSISSMSFWCKVKWLSEFVTRWFWTHLTKSRSHGAGLRTCQSSQEIQENLYLPTVTCDGGAPHNTAWSYLGLSMWAHKHHLYRIVALHWGAQHSRRQTKPYIYFYKYTVHTLHSLWVTVAQRKTAFIFILTQVILIWCNLQTLKCQRSTGMQMCFHSFLETQTMKLRVVGILAAITSHGRR